MRRTHQDRYEPTLAYMLAEQARSGGVDLDAAPGPWRASLLRHEFELLPVVTNDLRPVPDLTPPIDSELVEDEVLTGAR
jgi:hypothetical protein